jgi:hypothetical protein
MTKRTTAGIKRAIDRQINARIQQAITGFQIPLTSIVLLNKRLETAIANGANDDQLKQVVAETLAG